MATVLLTGPNKTYPGVKLKSIAHMLDTSSLTGKFVKFHLVHPKVPGVVEISGRNESVALTKGMSETILGQAVLNTCLQTAHPLRNGTAMEFRRHSTTLRAVVLARRPWKCV